MGDFTWDGPTLTDGAKYKVRLGYKGDCNSGSKTLTYHKPTDETYGTGKNAVNLCGNVKDGDTCNTFMTQLSKSDERMVQCMAEGAATHSGVADTCIADGNFEYYGVRSCPGGPGTTTSGGPGVPGPKGPSTTTTMSAWDHHQTLYIVLIIIVVCLCFFLAYLKWGR